MEKCKEILWCLLFPPLPFLCFAVPFASVWLIYSFAAGEADHPMTYGSYAFSAYALTIFCARLPRFAGRAKRLKREHPYVERYLSDVSLRLTLSLYGAVLLNGLYGMIQLLFGIGYGSLWFFTLAGYYLLLAAIRFFLLRDVRRDALGTDLSAQWRRYRFCGIALLLLNLVLAVMFTYIVTQRRGAVYDEIVTIALATYTFTALAVALRGMLKYRRAPGPLLSAAKYVSFTAAVVSFLPLETAMLSAFGTEGEELFGLVITAVSGAVICVVVLVIAVGMIARSLRESRKILH